MSEALLTLSGLSVEASGARTPTAPVCGVGFEIRPGESLALVGESGCGKSLTALALMRLLPPGLRVTEGEARWRGRDLLRISESEMEKVRGAEIAFIFQEPSTSFNPVMTVGEQVAEAILAHRPIPKREALREALEWLRRAEIPDAERSLRAFPHELSGGLKQRAMIAMALAARPKLIIADEPTTALDVVTQAAVIRLLRRLQREAGLAMLFITHDMALLPEAADRVALMYAGEIVETAPVEAFLRAPKHPYARALRAALPGRAPGVPLAALEGSVPSALPPLSARVGCIFAPRCPSAKPACFKRRPPLVRFSSESTVLCLEAKRLAACAPEEKRREEAFVGERAQEALLRVEALCASTPPRGWLARRPGEVILRDVSFAVRPGETLALVGASGSGKTTTALAMLGLIPSGWRTSGRIAAAGEAFEAAARRTRRFRQLVQPVFQDPYASLDPRMSVREILAEGLTALRPEWDAVKRDARMREVLAEVGLEADVLSRLPHEFSGGQRQRIAIARALGPGPRVLVLDEPTSALDVSVQARVLNLLDDLQRREGLAYLLITHNFGVVAHAAHSVAVMEAGRIVESGPTDRVLRAPQSEAAKRLLASVPVIEE